MHATMATSVFLAIVACAGCDCFAPAWVIDGKVTVPAAGRPLIVEITVDGVGPRIALATIADPAGHAFRWQQFGAGRSASLTAWIDSDGSSGLDALLAERRFTEFDERETPDDPGLVALRAADPSPGDPIAVSEELAFPLRESTCDSGAASVTLELVERPSACATPVSYGNATLGGAMARTAGPLDAPGHVGLGGALPGGARFSLELRAGRGAFASGAIVPGTYAIEGGERSQTTCGLCVRIATAGESYHASAGKVTLSAIVPRMIGSVSGVTLVEALVAPNGDTVPVEGGCTTHIDQLAFDVVVEDVGGG
jgi:hypothetical protein